MTALFADNPYAVWRVRLNNWYRVTPLYRDGVEVTWKSLRVYSVRVGGQKRIFRGSWAEVRDRIARYIADAQALDAYERSAT